MELIEGAVQILAALIVANPQESNKQKLIDESIELSRALGVAVYKLETEGE